MKNHKKVRLWSSNRPERPDVDPLLTQIVEMLRKDRRSSWDKADVSGLSESTLRNWESGKTKRPQAVSLEMAAKMLGKKIVLK